MAVRQVTLTVSAVTTGKGDGSYPSSQTINANAPKDGATNLNAGDNTIIVPSGFTVGSVWVKSDTASTNAKTYRKTVTDTQSAPFTFQPMIFPVAAGGSFIINSAGAEEVELFWCV